MGVMTRSVWVYLSIILAFYFSCNIGFSMPRSKREAGFYTTRYGRSDPMMRIHEAQTRYYPEPLPLGPKHLNSISVENEAPSETVTCGFSMRKKAIICKPRADAPSPWKKVDEALLLSYS